MVFTAREAPEMILLEDVHERAAVLEYDAGVPRAMANRRAWLEVMGVDMPYYADTVVFAGSPVDEDTIQAAKDWIRERGYTADDVAIRKSARVVYVVAKRELP